MFPFLSEALAVDHTVNSVVTQIGMYGLDHSVNLFRPQRTMPLKQVKDRLSKHCMHRAAGKPSSRYN
jgi:hypothetical protein